MTDRQTDRRTSVSAEVGVPHGHVPGHRFHDVEAEIELLKTEYHVRISETWGSAQGYDQEEGRRDVHAVHTDLERAIERATERARTSGMDMSWAVQAISRVELEARKLRTPQYAVTAHRNDDGDGWILSPITRGEDIHVPDGAVLSYVDRDEHVHRQRAITVTPKTSPRDIVRGLLG